MSTLYQIRSRVELPLRMTGEFSYKQAYDLVCAWNAEHPASDMAWVQALGNEIRTPNPDCPACKPKRLHTTEERKIYHPEAGKGFSRGVGQ